MSNNKRAFRFALIGLLIISLEFALYRFLVMALCTQKAAASPCWNSSHPYLAEFCLSIGLAVIAAVAFEALGE